MVSNLLSWSQVVLPTAAVVQNLKPNWPKMKEISSRGVIATALVGPDDVARDETLMSCDFVSRFFGAGFDDTREDPVTGSAHCTSAPYWAKIIRRDSLKACQVSLEQRVILTYILMFFHVGCVILVEVEAYE